MRLRTRLAALLVGGALTLAISAVAVAHFASAELVCSPNGVELRIHSSYYPDDSTYTFTIDGGSLQGPFDANTGSVDRVDTYDAGSPLVAHSAAIDFQSSDEDPAYNFHIDKSSVACVEPTQPPVTEPPVTEPPVTEPPVTEPPVTEPPVTEPPVTAPPSFTSSGEPATDLPSLPNTATLGGSGTSGPSDSSWLLVAALGVLLASVVVLTPARAKTRR